MATQSLIWAVLSAAAPLVALVPACSSGPVTGTGGAGDSSGAGGHGGARPSATSTTSTGAVAVGSGGSQPLPDKFIVKGVVTDGKSPVEGAIVMQAGGTPSFLTGADGAYSIELTTAIIGTPAVVAAKIGYRAAGLELSELPTEPVDLELRFVSSPDNPAYVFGDPGTGDLAHDNSTKYCGHCHTTLVKQFQTSAHAEATRSPLVQDLYAGVAAAFSTEAACAKAGGIWRVGLVPGTPSDAASKCYVGSGVLSDLNPACGGPVKASCDNPALDPLLEPKAFGRCADCHAPGIDGKAGGRDLHDAVGIAFANGNHCDVCHHARDVDLGKPPGVAGALVLQRPRDHLNDNPAGMLVQVMFGPLPDVPNGFMGGSIQPKFSTSELCGACHEQHQEAMVPGTALDSLRWPKGLPTHSTYSEWENSAFDAPATRCQFCHMPDDDSDLHNSLDVTDETNASITFGYFRPPERRRKHTFRDPLDGNPRFIDQAVVLGVAGASAGGELTVTVKLKNTGAGHAIPTGEPMRSLVLLVRADACAKAMTPSGGMTLDAWGGALAEGTVGPDATVNGAQVTWAKGAAAAKVGEVIRAVRATGMYDDYPGVGFFADPLLSPMEKGLEVHAPVGEATVMAVGGGVLTLSQALPVQMGDRLYLGEAPAFPPADGSPTAALAGSAGYSFARTLIDPLGRRGVPHYRAVDMISDNRLGPGVQATTTHRFAIQPGCATAKIAAVVLYRKLPLALARERGWDARDHVIATAMQSVALP